MLLDVLNLLHNFSENLGAVLRRIRKYRFALEYWVESHPTMQPYGAVLTEILNLDAALFQELLDQYRKTVAEKDAEQAARAFQAVTNGFASLPLYRLYWNDVQLFASMDVRELFVGEAQEAFCEYVMQDDVC